MDDLDNFGENSKKYSPKKEVDHGVLLFGRVPQGETYRMTVSISWAGACERSVQSSSGLARPHGSEVDY